MLVLLGVQGERQLYLLKVKPLVIKGCRLFLFVVVKLELTHAGNGEALYVVFAQWIEFPFQS